MCACCGTHVKRTGQIGPIKAVASEHYKTGIRISLQIGWKALEDYEEKHRNIKEISALLSAPPQETAEAVRKLQEQLQELKAANVALKQKPVSYTHLDVYKRQVLSLLLIIPTIVILVALRKYVGPEAIAKGYNMK